MRVVNGKKYHNATEVASLLNVDKKDLYYIIRKNKSWEEDSALKVFPEPISIDKSFYYGEDDIEVFAKYFSLVKGSKYKKAYEKLKEELWLERAKNTSKELEE